MAEAYFNPCPCYTHVTPMPTPQVLHLATLIQRYSSACEEGLQLLQLPVQRLLDGDEEEQGSASGALVWGVEQWCSEELVAALKASMLRSAASARAGPGAALAVLGQRTAVEAGAFDKAAVELVNRRHEILVQVRDDGAPITHACEVISLH